MADNFHILDMSKTHKTICVHNGRKLFLKAKYYPKVGWVAKLYGACWIDPAARIPSKVTGLIEPQYLTLKKKKDLLKILVDFTGRIE